jgi:hypothetical protein
MTQPNPASSSPSVSLLGILVGELRHLFKNPTVLATITGATYLFLESGYAIFYGVYFGVSLDEVGLTTPPQLLSKAVFSVVITLAMLLVTAAVIPIVNLGRPWLDRRLGIVTSSRETVRTYFVFVVPVLVATVAGTFWWNAVTYGKRAFRGRGGASVLGFQADPVHVISLTAGASLPPELRERNCLVFLGASSGMDLLFDIRLKQVLHIPTNGVALLGLPRLPNSCFTE